MWISNEHCNVFFQFFKKLNAIYLYHLEWLLQRFCVSAKGQFIHAIYIYDLERSFQWFRTLVFLNDFLLKPCSGGLRRSIYFLHPKTQPVRKLSIPLHFTQQIMQVWTSHKFGKPHEQLLYVGRALGRRP